MTHYTVDYQSMPDAIAHAKALTDIEEFLGRKRYMKICKALITEAPEGIPMAQFCGYLALFLGIEGYPVLALHRHLWPTAEALRNPEADPEPAKENAE